MMKVLLNLFLNHKLLQYNHKNPIKAADPIKNPSLLMFCVKFQGVTGLLKLNNWPKIKILF